MNNFVTFRHISNGEVRDYPAHYERHPILGKDLERYEPGNSEYEEDKVVVDDNHMLPVEQRVATVATEREKPFRKKREEKEND